MAWTGTNRARYERHSGRYVSDLTDQEWELVAPLLPPPKAIGRPRSTAMRDILDAIFFINVVSQRIIIIVSRTK